MHQTPLEILQKYWNAEQFRPLQKEIIDHVLSKKDTIVLLPTGGGKSICFQIPALIMDGLTIVISPLIALMNDQVEQLIKKGIPAATLYSGLTPEEWNRVREEALYGHLKILYLSPESLQGFRMKTLLEELPVSLIAVDEAHCISQWGHDFRPSYLQIFQLREGRSKVPVLALTATATREVLNDISTHFQLRNPLLFRQSFQRNNLEISIRRDDNIKQKILEYVAEKKDSTIIYCSTRLSTVQIKDWLCSNKISAVNYHAGMNKEEREMNRQKWMTGAANVMVATSAFGMGIDKKDVRMVIHSELPQSLEEWYQEIGRAGRDGQNAKVVSFYHDFSFEKKLQNIDRQFPEEQFLRKVYQSVAEYYQIPIGAEPDKVYPFSFETFTKNFKLENYETFYALRILEQEGLWTISEGISRPNTVQFLCTRTDVDELANGQPQWYNVCLTLLRMYPGILSIAKPIHILTMARKMKVDLHEIDWVLKKLDQLGYLKYEKYFSGAHLHFHHYRVDSRHLILNTKRIQQRKNIVLQKLNSIRQMAQLEDDCRTKFVLNYFGEKSKTDCGYCDNCRKSGGERARVLNKLSFHFKEQSKLNLDNLLSEFTIEEQPIAMKIIADYIRQGRIKKPDQHHIVIK